MESIITHHDYLQPADALDREMMAGAIAWGKIARGIEMPFNLATAAEA
jgi:hypothetical protein